MNKILILLFLWIVYTSCANERKDVSAFVLVEDEFNEEIMNCKIVSVVEEIIRINWPKKFLSSDSAIYCIAVTFITDLAIRRATANDTLIRFTYYIHKVDRVDIGYKGIMIINGYPIAIFDKDNIGYNYYDEADLVKYPLEKFTDLEIPAFFNGYNYGRLVYYFKFENGDLYNLYPMDSDNLYGL